MMHDSTPLRVFNISELTRVITSQLVLVSRRSAVNLACACRRLEEPVLSTLWETQPSLCTLLKTLPEYTWDWGYHPAWGTQSVRGVDRPSGEIDLTIPGCVSSRSWGIRRPRLGTESNAMHLGCTKSAWIWRGTLRSGPSTHYASTHLLADGSQRYKIYFGASRGQIFPMPTCSSPHI